MPLFSTPQDLWRAMKRKQEKERARNQLIMKQSGQLDKEQKNKERREQGTENSILFRSYFITFFQSSAVTDMPI